MHPNFKKNRARRPRKRRSVGSQDMLEVQAQDGWGPRKTNAPTKQTLPSDYAHTKTHVTLTAPAVPLKIMAFFSFDTDSAEPNKIPGLRSGFRGKRNFAFRRGRAVMRRGTSKNVAAMLEGVTKFQQKHWFLKAFGVRLNCSAPKKRIEKTDQSMAL